MATERRRVPGRTITCTDPSGIEAIVQEHIVEVRQRDSDGPGQWILDRRQYTLAGRPVNALPDGSFQTVDPPERLLRPSR